MVIDKRAKSPTSSEASRAISNFPAWICSMPPASAQEHATSTYAMSVIRVG